MTRHNEFLQSFLPNTFVGNHDVTRIASTLGPREAVVAAAILMTVGGIPSIYSGDEQGFTGVKEARIGGDDAVRPPFPDSPEALLPLGEPIFRAHQDLIGLRRRHPWLTSASTTRLALENSRLSYRASARDGADFIDVHINLEGSPVVAIRDSSGQLLWELPA